MYTVFLFLPLPTTTYQTYQLTILSRLKNKKKYVFYYTYKQFLSKKIIKKVSRKNVEPFKNVSQFATNYQVSNFIKYNVRGLSSANLIMTKFECWTLNSLLTFLSSAQLRVAPSDYNFVFLSVVSNLEQSNTFIKNNVGSLPSFCCQAVLKQSSDIHQKVVMQTSNCHKFLHDQGDFVLASVTKPIFTIQILSLKNCLMRCWGHEIIFSP